MKKIILTVAAVFALTFANAQDKKESTGEGFSNGDLYLTGTAGFSSEKAGNTKADGFTLTPGVGYFIRSEEPRLNSSHLEQSRMPSSA